MAPEASQDASPAGEELLNQLIYGMMTSQCVYVAARLGIVDVLRAGPKTADEIARAVGAHEAGLRRLLRALTTIGLLVANEDGRFAPTPIGERLRSDHPQSSRPRALLAGAPFVWRPWGDLYESIMTNTPAFDRVYGEAFFEYLRRRPAEAAIFNAAMTSFSSGSVPAILAAYDFTNATRIVDVGGGQGALLRGILEQYPQARGVLFDQPLVVEQAQALWDTAVATRCEFIGGDMFQGVPTGDIYILRQILHDWSDAEVVQILRHCRQAISDGGRLLVMDLVLKPFPEPDPVALADLNMLVVLPGRERTQAEFQELFAAAGFGLTQIIPLGADAIIEGAPQ